MGARTKYRKRALDVLYESEARGLGPDGTLDERVQANDPPINPYTIELVEGVAANQSEIDELLSQYAEGWTLERMPAVDRNLLRIAVFELRHRPDVPKPVVISEAVELATELSTDESPRFINGLLGRIAKLSTTE